MVAMGISRRANIKPHRKYNKRTGAEIIRDRQRVSELYYQGYKDDEISEILHQETGIRLSPRQIRDDRTAILEQYWQRTMENMEAHMADALLRLEQLEREAWVSYRRTVSPEEELLVMEKIGKAGDLTPSMRQKITRSQSGSERHLEIILKCIQERNRLHGLSRLRLDIKQETTHKVLVKGFVGISPDDWDAVQDNQLTVSEVVQRQLTAGEEVQPIEGEFGVAEKVPVPARRQRGRQ
jgi:hypothetical protein